MEKKIFFKPYEWKAIADLLDKGYSLKDAIQFLGYTNHEILNDLEKGKDLKTVLLTYTKGSFKEHLRFFLHITNVQNAIYSSLELCDFEKNLWKKLSRQCSYPMLIFFFSYLTLSFFQYLIIPSLVSGFDTNETGIMFYLLHVLSIFSHLITFVLLVIFLTVLLFVWYKPVKIPIFNFLKDYFSLVKEMVSYVLSGYLLQMEKRGLSSRQSFYFLTQLDETSVIYHVSKELQLKLTEGTPYDQVILSSLYLSKRMKQSYLIGMKSLKLQSSLENYMCICEEMFQQFMKKAGLFIQFLSYGFVGVMVIVVYQMMLIPLSSITM